MRTTARAVAAALVALAFGVAPATDSAVAARTTYDSNGTVLWNGKKAFLIGLLRPPPLDARTPWGTNALDEVVAAGVNILAAGPYGRDWTDEDVPDVRLWSAAAAARGAGTWVNLRELARAQPGTEEELALKHVVASLKDERGLAMWKGPDEPWWSGWRPASLLQHAYATTKAIDPNHLWDIIQAPRGTAADLAPYSEVTDGHAVDVYPVRFGVTDPQLDSVGRWTALIRSITPNKVVFTTLQICFSGSDDPAGSGAYVMPTLDQERYMAYDAIVNGARGLFFFGGNNPRCFGAGDAELGWNWTFWSVALRSLVAELGPRSRLYPALVSPGTQARLPTTDPSTNAVRRRGRGRDLWVIATRRGAGTKRVTVRGLPRSLTRGTVYREGRSIRVRNGTFTDSLSRWGVHVYHFGP